MPKAKTKFLFVFGFEDPIEFKTNKDSGTDFESSRAVWIVAEDSAEAENWGRSIAENYVRHLFGNDDSDGYSWSDAQFSHWIETDPSADWEPEHLASLPIVRAGAFPEFDSLDNPNRFTKTNSESGPRD